MIKAVLFDLDGTLLDRDASLQQFIAAQYDRFAPHLSHVSKRDYIDRFVHLDCRGHIWKDKVYQSLISESRIDGLSWENLLDDYELKFMCHCVPFQHLQETLILLKQQGYLLGIITNGRSIFQTRSIQGLGIQSYFDTVLISEVEQVRKPQPEIFHRALHRLEVSAEESVFVGDHPEVDIIGAKGAGLKAIWRCNPFWANSSNADATINELNEIPIVLQQFS